MWDPPKDVLPAKEVYKLSKTDPSESARIRHNVNSALEERQSLAPSSLDLTLAGVIKKNKNQVWDEDVGEKDSDTGKEEESTEHEAETKNKGAGKAGNSTDVPERQRSGSNNPVLTPPYKRKAGEPDSSASIERMAKSHWRSFATKMKRKMDADYPRRFVNIRGEEHWEIADFPFGLTFQIEDYSPILQRQ